MAAAAEPVRVPPRPSPDDLIAAARALVPALESRAAHCEALGRVPDETQRELLAAGLYRILQPARYGGYEHEPTVHYRVVMELARGCPSTAWVYSILGIHQWEVGAMDPRVGEALWRDDANVLFSSSYAPYGTARKVDGGYVLNGRWPWSTGCDHCQWAILGAVAAAEDDEQCLMAFLIPRADYRILADSWHYAGMAGTGSKTVEVTDAFVPAWRKHNVQRAIHLDEPGWATFTAPIYRYPFGVVFGYTLAAVALGVADAALDRFVDYVRGRRDAFTAASFGEDPITQQAIAEVHWHLDGARLRLERDWREMAQFVADGVKIPLERRVLYKYDVAMLADTAREAVNRIVKTSGGTTFDLANPMQRYFRDINTMANHLYVNPRKGGVNLGLNLLTGGNTDPLL